MSSLSHQRSVGAGVPLLLQQTAAQRLLNREGLENDSRFAFDYIKIT